MKPIRPGETKQFIQKNPDPLILHPENQTNDDEAMGHDAFTPEHGPADETEGVRDKLEQMDDDRNL